MQLAAEQAAVSHDHADAIAGAQAVALCKAEVHLPEGRPSEQIARLAAERESDLIVIGKHGQNWVQRMVIGSTAANLCETARRPVLMVPLKHPGA